MPVMPTFSDQCTDEQRRGLYAALREQGVLTPTTGQVEAELRRQWRTGALTLHEDVLNLSAATRDLIAPLVPGPPTVNLCVAPPPPTNPSGSLLNRLNSARPLYFLSSAAPLRPSDLHLLDLPLSSGYLTFGGRVVSTQALVQAYNASNLAAAEHLARALNVHNRWEALHDHLRRVIGPHETAPSTVTRLGLVDVGRPAPLSGTDVRHLTELHRLTPGRTYTLHLHWQGAHFARHEVYTSAGERVPLHVPAGLPSDLPRLHPDGTVTHHAMDVTQQPDAAAHQAAMSLHLHRTQDLLTSRDLHPDLNQGPTRTTRPFTASP